MDAATAREHGFAVGDRVRVLLDGPAQRVPHRRHRSTLDFGAVTWAAFDLPTAQAAFDAERTLDRIYVQREPDVSERVAPAPARAPAR